mgnify:FL=1
MKGLELNVTKQNGMTLVEYQLGVADVYDDRVSDKVAQLGNIIPFQYKDEDGKRSIVSYVHHDTSLEVMLRQTLKKADVLAILKGLLCAFEIGAAGVQICYLVRDLNYIYVDPESKAVKCIMVPVKQDPLGQSDIPDFFRNIVSHMRFDEADKDDYVARILTLINTDHYSNMKLKGLVDAEMEKLGLFYTRDEGLKKEADTTPAPEVQNQNVKVNRVGVMNNMRPQGMPAMGQPMGQPVQPQMGYQQPQQPMGGYYQPRSNNAAAFGAGINGYLGYVKENPMNILKIVGAFFVFLATLIPWAHATYWGVTEHWNLFKAGGFNRFIAIIVLLLSLVLIAWEVADFIPVPQIANVKAKLQAIPYFEFILLGVIFVFVLIATIRHGYAHSDGTTVNFREYGIKVGISAGVIFAYLGVIAAAAPRVLDKLGIKIGNK